MIRIVPKITVEQALATLIEHVTSHDGDVARFVRRDGHGRAVSCVVVSTCPCSRCAQSLDRWCDEHLSARSEEQDLKG
jgi:hypothetical protein